MTEDQQVTELAELIDGVIQDYLIQVQATHIQRQNIRYLALKQAANFRPSVHGKGFND